MSENSIFDIAVLGGGPAGYTAGIYSGRASLKTIIFEGWQPGGQLTTTTVIENFPGFKDGIEGPKLMAEMRAQAERFCSAILNKMVTRVDLSTRPFKIYTENEEYSAKALIIATGAKPRVLGLDSEKKLWAKGVSTCATCDGFFFRNKTVAVIGGGDSAMEEGNFLTNFASKVYIINRSEQFRASQIMLDRASNNPKIEIVKNKLIEEILGDIKVTGLKLKDAKTGEISELAVDGMFLAIGHIPVTDLFKGQMELDNTGFIKLKENTMTSVPGVFAAGDVADFRYRQAITSAGSGCMASIDAKKWLENNE